MYKQKLEKGKEMTNIIFQIKLIIMRNTIFLCSEMSVKNATNLPDNFFAEWLSPCIQNAQTIGLQNIIGSCLYNRLLQMVTDGTINDPSNSQYKYVLDNQITDYLIWETVVYCVQIAYVKIDNLGDILSNDEHTNNLSYRDKDLVKRYYQQISDSYRLLLQNYLKNNRDLFPELQECNCYGISPTLDSSNSSNIFTGGRRSIKGLRLFKR